jgi:glycosyltransferase involved in cell wall biosynthesis
MMLSKMFRPQRGLKLSGSEDHRVPPVSHPSGAEGRVMAEEQRVTPEPHVTILMATYNGEKYLAQQLESIAAQTHKNWILWIGDDGSEDGTLGVIETFKQRGHDVTLLRSPGEGSSANFMALLRCGTDIDQPEWIAFSDQDDVWLPDKLERGVAALRDLPAGIPALYCSRTFIVDVNLKLREKSLARPRPLGFRNAIVQNVASGNTLVLNPTAAHLVRSESKRAGEVVVHDWWIYQLISGVGGALIHDDMPSLLYRQHADNVIGANTGARARLLRIRMLLNGDFGKWNAKNIAALERSADRLTPENIEILRGFAELRRAPFLRRLLLFHRLRLYRQTTIGTIAIWLAVVLGRI